MSFIERNACCIIQNMLLEIGSYVSSLAQSSLAQSYVCLSQLLPNTFCSQNKDSKNHCWENGVKLLTIMSNSLKFRPYPSNILRTPKILIAQTRLKQR